MKEVVFLHKNMKRWEEYDKLLSAKEQIAPDFLANMFIEITDDLSYSRTYYKNSQTTEFLNQLALKIHTLIYRNKREKTNRISTFFAYELPLVFKEARKEIFYSFTIFFIAVLIGIISTAYDDSFVRLILGDDYVDMTLINIENGDPMAVYKQSLELNMFVGISLNNIRVSFMAFVMGIFFSFGTGYILFSNGVMLGTFQYFFFKQGLLLESVLTIWIHGTLEIWAIIMAGAAGLLIGNSIIFPETYSRIISLRKAVRKGLKIIIGLIPIFIVAAFFEGFLTRHTEFPYFIRATVIALSLAFIVWYFFLLPNKIYKKLVQNKIQDKNREPEFFYTVNSNNLSELKV